MHVVIVDAMAGLLLYVSAQEKPRVFISDSQSWEVMGGFNANKDRATGSIAGGSSPQTAEIIKTLGKKCQDVTVTMNREKGNYVALIEHDGGKTIWEKDTKFVIFTHGGDAIKSGSARTISAAVKDSCDALIAPGERGDNEITLASMQDYYSRISLS